MRNILHCSILTLALVIVFSTVAISKGGKIHKGSELKYKKAVLVEPASPAQVAQSGRGLGIHKAGALTFVDVDEMSNEFGPANSDVNPITADYLTGNLALIHRARTTYGAGSGQMWYNISTDGGATWTRSASAVNGPSGVANAGRYPSMTISNYTGAPAVVAYFAYPQLTPSAFGFAVYGLDVFGEFNASVVEDQGTAAEYWSSLVIWPSDNSADVYWTSRTSNDNVQLFRTGDFGITYDKSIPPSLAADQFTSLWDVAHGDARNGTSYIGVVAQFASQLGTPQEGTYDYGVISSTDNGVTWSTWSLANWKSIPALAAYDDQHSYTGNLAHDFLVDDGGNGHFFASLVDTNTTPETGSVVEIYQTASGWNAKIVADITTSLIPGFPAVDQMDNELFCARSWDGTVFAAKWIDATAEGDSVPDMFLSYRAKGGDWAAPINMTETPTAWELSTHLAPQLTSSGNTHTAHMFKTYEIGNPDRPVGSVVPAAIAYANYSFTVTSVEKLDDVIPSAYSLKQNYPNPFNPSTRIEYSVPMKSLVTLKVYNSLGQEVATLVSEEQEPGRYAANFDASRLSSGVYLYTLQAGSFAESKKMTLVK